MKAVKRIWRIKASYSSSTSLAYPGLRSADRRGKSSSSRETLPTSLLDSMPEISLNLERREANSLQNVDQKCQSQSSSSPCKERVDRCLRSY